MSTTTVNLSLTILGSPVDATAATLGVIRNDTLAVVVPPGTPFVHLGTGQYQYQITDPAFGLIYTVTKNFSYSGSDYEQVDIVPGTTAVTGPTSGEIFIVQTDIENVFGAQFVAQWSSFEQGATSPTASASRIAIACNIGKAWFNGKVGTGPYSTPVSAPDILAVPEVVDAMATYAGWWLFKSRGLNYAEDTLKWMNEHYKRISFFASDVRFGRYPLACALNTSRRQTPFSVGR